MGNYVSCTLLGPSGKNSDRAVTKVVFPGGEIRRFRHPVKAAELMLEIPNFFVVNTASLQTGKRFAALHADEDLEPSNVYVFFPMKRLNSVVTAADMGSRFMTGKRASVGSVRVSPECGQDVPGEGDCPAPGKLKLDEMEDDWNPAFRQRWSMCRSKKPVLETIEEEHLTLRLVMMMDN